MGRQAEVAFVGLAGVLVVLAWAAAAGVGLAAAVFGGGWVWPTGSDRMVAVLAGLLNGHPGQGFPPDLAARLPGRVAVYVCVAGLEFLTVLTALVLVVMVARYRRPGDARRGMATRAEAARALGVRRLRGAATVIRPDLTGDSFVGGRWAALVFKGGPR